MFFSNEKESHFHNMLMPNVFVRIFPNGNIFYSTRISLTLDCPMNLQRYPFDRQDCPLRMISCIYKMIALFGIVSAILNIFRRIFY